MRVLLALAVIAPLSACGNKITTINPTPVAFTTFKLSGGTIDPNHPCTPPTPPAPSDPSPPAATEVLVGYQDWRNTVADASGQCQSSNAKRWEGVVTFDMTPVVSNITATPFKTLTGTIDHDPTSVKVPQGFNVIEMCTARLELTTTPPASTGLVTLNFLGGQNFPGSTNPTLGVLNQPPSAPAGQVSHHGSVTVDAAPPFPTVTSDISLILSDWASTRPPSLAIVFVPQGPTLATMGIANGTPVPVNRNVQCVSVLRRFAMTVHVGR
jgi:hypothetical protein